MIKITNPYSKLMAKPPNYSLMIKAINLQYGSMLRKLSSVLVAQNVKDN